MRYLLILTVLLFSFCSKKEQPPAKELPTIFFEVDSKVLTQNGDTILANEQFYNNTIITASEHVNITSSEEDIDILLKKDTQAGFFQNDSVVYIIVYTGMIRVIQKDSNRLVSVKTMDDKTYTLHGGNIVIQTFDFSQEVSISKEGTVVDKEPILLGELYYADKVRSEIQYLSKKFLTNSVEWLDSVTYNELLALYMQPGKYPTIVPFKEVVDVHAKQSMILKYNKRDKSDEVKVLSYKIPKGAVLKEGKILWRPTKQGKYKFGFKLTDGSDTTTSHCFVRVGSTLRGDVKTSTKYLGNNKTEVTFNLNNIRSKKTGKKGLSFKITGKGKSLSWTTDKIIKVTTSAVGKIHYRILVKSKSGEMLERAVVVTTNTPPKIVFSLNEKEYYVGSKLILDLSKSFDDLTKNLTVDAVVKVNNETFNLSFKSAVKKGLLLSQAGMWELSLTLTDEDGLKTTEKFSFKVINKLSAELEKSYTINVNQQFSEKIKISGNNPKKAILIFGKDTTVLDTKKSSFLVSKKYKKEGVYPFSFVVVDAKDQVKTYKSQINVVNMLGKVSIQVISKNLSVNRPIIFQATTAEGDNTIEKIRWDFTNRGKWDKQTLDGRNVTYIFQKKGTYTVVCEMLTNDGKTVRGFKDVEIINTAPIAIAPEPIALTRPGDITLTGDADDKEKTRLFYSWDINSDGKYDYFGKTISVKILEYTKITLKVMDTDSLYTTDTTKVVLCPRDMRLVKEGLYCIDRYEYPNTKGVIPTVEATYDEAEAQCKSKGKRLCYETEWEQACKGKNNSKFSYGNELKPNACNIYGQKNKPVFSGKKMDCESFYGTFSQNGNVAEWTKKSGAKANVYGGSYFSKGKNSACDSKVLLDKNKKLPYVGFRCCK